jgi:predicted aldo/keto reductase-like oxidoreductase
MTILDHVKENVATFSPLVPCTDKEFAMLEDIAAAMVAYPLIGCTACSYCMPCKFGVDIPGNFAAWNKAVNEGKVPPAGKGDPDYESRRKAFAAAFKASVPASDLATACRNCRACLRNCPQRIQIPTHMQRIASLLG